MKYLALDIETTGVHEGKRGWHQVVQLSIVEGCVTSDKPGQSITFFLSTPDWGNGEPYALAMNLISWQDARALCGSRLVHTEQAKGACQAFLNARKHQAFAGFNVGSFDRQFLPGLIAPHRHWDVGSMWAAKFGPSPHNSVGIWTSEEISKELGLGEVKHDAYQDNLITIAAMHRIFEGV